MTATGKEFDAADRRLINAVQKNNRRSLAELAEETNLTIQTCQRRLQRIRDTGLFLKEVAIVDPRRTPRPVSVIIDVSLERLTEATRRQFESRIRAVPEIMQCWAVSGEPDYMIFAQVAHIDDYYTLVNDLLVEDENVKHFRTAFTLTRVKYETAIEF